MEKIYLASLNKAKVIATKKVFDDFEIIPTEVHMTILQPLSEEDTFNCAKNRALSLPNGYRLGLEAGAAIICDKCFLVNCGVLIDQDNHEYYAAGSYIELPNIIKNELYQNHLELKDAMIKHYGDVIKETGGAIEFLTNGELTRVDIFTHIGKLLKGQLERKENA